MKVEELNDTFLEIVSDFHDEERCESKHSGHLQPDCSVKVVARKRTCKRPEGFNICFNALKWNFEAIAQGILCDGCHRPGSFCWDIQAA